jgi:16S rRNA (uracil1498-N3)-methyltransferase
MQYNYHQNAGDTTIVLTDSSYKHLFKSRREDKSKNQFFRNLQDSYVYEYSVSSVDKKSATLTLVDSIEVPKKLIRNLHLGWAVIELKSIEKVIPLLNELGVNKITFFYAKRSQKNYKIDIERINRIVINSSMQCGRDSMMDIEVLKDLDEFISHYPDSHMLNFSENKEIPESLSTIIVGPEGGFDDSEVALFEDRVIGIKSHNILKSETATVAISSKILI